MPDKILLTRLSKRRQKALWDLMVNLHFQEKPINQLSVLSEYFDRPRASRMRRLFSNFLATVMAEKIEPVEVLFIAASLAQFAKIELNNMLPADARLDLPRLYEAIEEAARIWGDDEELCMEEIRTAVMARQPMKRNPGP